MMMDFRGEVVPVGVQTEWCSTTSKRPSEDPGLRHNILIQMVEVW